MSKIAFYKGDGDISSFTTAYKSAMIKFEGGLLFPLPLTKRFAAGEEKKGYEQLKRWVSSSAFSLIVLDGFGDAFALMNDKAEVVKWISEHSSEPDFPFLLITGKAIDGIEYREVKTASDL